VAGAKAKATAAGARHHHHHPLLERLAVNAWIGSLLQAVHTIPIPISHFPRRGTKSTVILSSSSSGGLRR